VETGGGEWEVKREEWRGDFGPPHGPLLDRADRSLEYCDTLRVISSALNTRYTLPVTRTKIQSQ
jgi:hypothetical protein